MQLTSVISAYRRLDQSSHPFSRSQRFPAAEIVCDSSFAHDPESVASCIHIFVCNYTISLKVNVTFDLGVLRIRRQYEELREGKFTDHFATKIIEMRALQNQVSQLPKIMTFSLLPQPPVKIWFAKLLEHISVGLQGENID